MLWRIHFIVYPVPSRSNPWLVEAMLWWTGTISQLVWADQTSHYQTLAKYLTLTLQLTISRYTPNTQGNSSNNPPNTLVSIVLRFLCVMCGLENKFWHQWQFWICFQYQILSKLKSVLEKFWTVQQTVNNNAHWPHNNCILLVPLKMLRSWPTFKLVWR